MTEAERWLLRLIADAMMHPEAQHAPIWQHNIRKAYAVLDNEAPQGSQRRWVCPRCGHDLETSIALLGPPWADKPPDPNA